MDIYIPNKIKEYIGDKEYNIETIGRSDSTVITFEDMVLKIENNSECMENSIKTMRYLSGKICVPEVIHYEIYEEKMYLLMSKVKGKMSCDKYFLDRPEELVSYLVKALEILWGVNILNYPYENILERKLNQARYNVENNLIDINDWEEETLSKFGFSNPYDLLKWLEENKPDLEPVLSHGDFCLPNIFIEKDNISGFIDLGDMGINDRWQDIALCYRSLKHNFDGHFGEKIYKDFNPDILFDSLKMQPNWEKIKYFTLLDELF